MDAGGPKGDLFRGWGDFGGPSNLKGTLKETKGEVPPRGTLFGDYGEHFKICSLQNNRRLSFETGQENMTF